MATGKLDSTRYTNSSSPYEASFSASFSARAKKSITAQETGITIPSGWVAVISGFGTSWSAIIPTNINPNATDSEYIIEFYDRSSASEESYVFRYSFIRLNMLQDERETS